MIIHDLPIRALSVREGRVDERLALEDLQRRACLAREEYRRRLLDNPDVIDLPRAHLADGHVRVAERDGHTQGFAVVLPGRGGVFVLDGLFVEPGHWLCGIGRALVADACARLRQRGAARLEAVANLAAEGFYERLGFLPVATDVTAFGPARRMQLEIQDFPAGARQS